MARVPYVVKELGDYDEIETFESDMAERYTGTEQNDGTVVEELFRTDDGRWVLNVVRADGRANTWNLVSDTLAATWLSQNGHPEARRRWFDQPKGGRPSKGTRVEMKLPARQLVHLDAAAEEWGVDRSTAATRMAILGIASRRMAAWFDRSNDIGRALTQVAQGRTHDLGDFSHYAD